MIRKSVKRFSEKIMLKRRIWGFGSDSIGTEALAEVA
jgi:hypothetical protein